MTAEINTEANNKMKEKFKEYNKILALDDKYNLQTQ